MEQTIEVLTKGSLTKNVRFKDVYYSNLSWIVSNNLDSTILKAMDEKLNDDCTRYIIKHLNVKDLIFFKNFNGRFQALVVEKMSKLRIFPCTVGAIDLMNLRYILHMFGSYVTEILISLLVFPPGFGHYFEHTKKSILQLTISYTGQQLKKIYLHDFNFNENEKKNCEHLFRLLSEQDIEYFLM